MTRKVLSFVVLVLMLSIWTTAAMAEDGEHAYVGLKKCKMCHKKEASGNQFGIWSEGPHAKAFADLTSEAGLAKAAELGVEDPATSADCLSCHATAYGVSVEMGGDKLLMENGVTCESCHGAGADYYTKKTMAGITAGEIDGAGLGLLAQTEDVCLTCHKADNPGHEGAFDFEKFVVEIAHPLPAAE